jgi:O-antigen/teichoic acid export membrane protein
MGFILLLTRSMTKAEYGVWSNIFDLTAYFVLFSGFVPFWATRFVARAKESTVKTALLANLTVGIIAAVIYIVLVPSVTTGLHINGTYLPVYLLASLQLLSVYLISILESCLRARKPQAIGYGLLIEEATKLTSALIFIIILHQLFIGAMLSLILAASVQTFYYLKLLNDELKLKVRWSYFRQWLKGSAVMFYNAIGTQAAAYVLILLIVYGGQPARADYQASATFATIIGYSISLAFALYPKLLAENSFSEITTTLRTVLLFAFPLTAIIIATSPSLLTVLNASYTSAWPVLTALSLDALFVLITQFYTNVLYGTEKLDEEARIPLRKLIKSPMFRLLSLPYLQSLITLPTIFILLTQFTSQTAQQSAFYVAFVALIGHTIILFSTCVVVGKCVEIKVPWQSTGKYILVSALTGLALYLLPHPKTLFLTFATVITGAALYAVITIIIDQHTRNLIKQILLELRLKQR